MVAIAHVEMVKREARCRRATRSPRSCRPEKLVDISPSMEKASMSLRSASRRI